MTSDDVRWPEFHETWQKCSLPLYLTCVKRWSHLHMASPHSRGLLSSMHEMGPAKWWRQLSPRKPPDLGFWACNCPQIFTQPVKLNFRRWKIVAGLRPAPIFQNSNVYSRGGNFAPPTEIGLKRLNKCLENLDNWTRFLIFCSFVCTLWAIGA